jgi:DMSO/TMAO reductase YedYZ molybdopterin-dependent catalytic subunit
MKKLNMYIKFSAIFLVFIIISTGCSVKTEDIEIKQTSVQTESELDLTEEEIEKKLEVESNIITESEEDKVDKNITDEVEKEVPSPSTSGINIEKPSETIDSSKEYLDESSVYQEEKPKEESEIKLENLKILGNVEFELNISLDELKNMEDIVFEGTYYSLNSFGTTGYTDFKGVNLWLLLEKAAAISSDAAYVRVVAVDGYEMSFTVEQVKKQDYIDETDSEKKLPIIIAWEENGQEYDLEEGAPYKLVVGQKEAGDVNKPQWVSKIDRIIVE